MPTKPDKQSATKILCDMGFTLEFGQHWSQTVYWVKATPSKGEAYNHQGYFDAEGLTPDLAAAHLLTSVRAHLKPKAPV